MVTMHCHHDDCNTGWMNSGRGRVQWRKYVSWRIAIFPSGGGGLCTTSTNINTPALLKQHEYRKSQPTTGHYIHLMNALDLWANQYLCCLWRPQLQRLQETFVSLSFCLISHLPTFPNRNCIMIHFICDSISPRKMNK